MRLQYRQVLNDEGEKFIQIHTKIRTKKDVLQCIA
jgi:hypothetical protein